MVPVCKPTGLENSFSSCTLCAFIVKENLFFACNQCSFSAIKCSFIPTNSYGPRAHLELRVDIHKHMGNYLEAF